MDSRKQVEAKKLAESLFRMRSEMQDFAAQYEHLLPVLDPAFTDSAKNLLHYLSLRRQDLRPIQQRLTDLGLSSLGRAEANVLWTIDRVLETLGYLAGEPVPSAKSFELDSESAKHLLDSHTTRLLGTRPNNRNVRIMVTMPRDAASDYQLVHDLVAAGMDCMRIYCAHDDASAWARMIDHLNQAKKALDRPCRIQMDLAGPKLRTSDIHQHLSARRLKPVRDPTGHVTQPARLSLISHDGVLPESLPCARVDARWLGLLVPGDIVKLTDARGAHRKWRVRDVSDQRADVEIKKTTYLAPGTLLTLKRDDKPATEVIDLPVRDGSLTLFAEDRLVIKRTTGETSEEKCTGCSLPQVFDDVGAGESILFDDGRG
ncbi:MAG: hypothetical protein ACFHX7_12420 [Pseudomonadota bacterium]